MEHIDTIKWAVVFTDIKDFTLKTSLLTQLQITKFLNKQDEIVLPIIVKYFWKVVKTIWDAYMIVFEKAENNPKLGNAWLNCNKLYQNLYHFRGRDCILVKMWQ